MKVKNIINAVLIFLGLICIEFVGTYAYRSYNEPGFELLGTNDLKIHYLDVGQGDSTFIELPNGKTFLIDAGEVDYGKSVVNYIKKLNYTKIDYVFATHPHSDHIGGMAEVIKNFNVGNIYMPNVSSNSSLYLDLLKVIEAKNKKIVTATAGKSVVESEDLSLKILAPMNKVYEELNNYSIVLKLTYKEKSFLFMADAEYDVEMDLLNNKTDIKADVLKVGHHGSTSSTNYNFLKKVSPEIGVISVGANNDYGHPKEKILEKFKNQNVKVYRTDLNGNIVILSDGIELKVKVEHGSYSWSYWRWLFSFGTWR